MKTRAKFDIEDKTRVGVGNRIVELVRADEQGGNLPKKTYVFVYGVSLKNKDEG